MALQQTGNRPFHQAAKVRLLVDSLYESTRRSTALTNQAHTELGLLQAVLSTTEAYTSSLGADCINLTVLKERLQSCHDILLELQELQLHPDTFGAQSQISDIRARFSSLIFGLSEVNTNMMISSQKNIDHALRCLVDDIRTGKREVSLLSEALKDSPNREEESWKRLQEALSAAIASELLTENHEYVIATLRKWAETDDLLSVSGTLDAPVVAVPETTAPAPTQGLKLQKSVSEDPLADEPTGLPFLPLPPKGFSYSDKPRPYSEQIQPNLEKQPISEENLSMSVMSNSDFIHTEKEAVAGSLPVENLPIPVELERQIISRENDLPIPVTIPNDHPPQKPDLQSFKVLRSKKSRRMNRIIWDITRSKAPFITAIIAGQQHTVRALLEKGADVNAQNTEGQTALMAAVSFGHEIIARLLLEYGAEMNIRTMDGETALGAAASRGFDRIVRMLVASGADLDAGKGLAIGKTALGQAAAYGQDQIVQLLLDCGADINGTGGNGETALALAAVNGNMRVARVLLDRGALVDHMRYPWQTPLYKAVSSGHGQMVKLLVERGADPLVKGGARRTETVLAYAARLQRREILGIFAQSGHRFDTGAHYYYS